MTVPHVSLLQRLYLQQTISGKPIKPTTQPENELRYRALLITNRVREELWADLSPELASKYALDDALTRTLRTIQKEYDDPRHYGDNKPGKFSLDGKSADSDPNPRFNYSEFLGFALSGYEETDYFAAFAKDVGLDAIITQPMCWGLVALLLVDEAITEIECNRMNYATRNVFEALESCEVMENPRRLNWLVNSVRKELATKGGHARHGETNSFKKEVLEKWKSGHFEGNKSAAARWATKEFPVKNQETVKKWIRKYEQENTTT